MNTTNKKLQIGIYEHYKGNRYKVIGIARHSETLEDLVVYRAQYGERDLWVRPLTMFLETVTINGKKIPRFKFIDSGVIESENIESTLNKL